jgi:hypothetical protein
MSEQTIQRRAATVRRTWTGNERRQRALVSDRRCLDLLLRITTGKGCGPVWSTKTPA